MCLCLTVHGVYGWSGVQRWPNGQMKISKMGKMGKMEETSCFMWEKRG